jgi:hypothetical protein
MKKLLLGVLALGAIAFAQDKVIDGVVYTEKVVEGKLIWVKKMVPKKTYVTVEKIIMVPAPVTSNMLIVTDSYVNPLGEIVSSNRAQARRTVRRIENRND